MDQAEILEGAQAIRPHLKRLIGEKADSVESELVELLAQAQEGRQVDVLVLRLLARYSPTREWITQFLQSREPSIGDTSQVKSFEPLAGSISALPGTMYHCTQCEYQWYRHSVGVSIPECPTHHIPLVEIVA